MCSFLEPPSVHVNFQSPPSKPSPDHDPICNFKYMAALPIIKDYNKSISKLYYGFPEPGHVRCYNEPNKDDILLLLL